MSAPLAGKFQDHYVFLGIDPGADTETIQIAYAKMIEKYGPEGDNDPEKLEMINSSYETLSDPGLRKEFDKVKGVSGDRGKPMFTGVQFFDLLGQQVGLRGALLSILYDRRRTKPFTPALSMRHLEAMLEAEIEALNFALWYLKQRGFISPDDKSSLQITATGMDYLETNRPVPEEVMPFIRLSAIADSQLAKPQAVEASEPTEPRVETEAETEAEAELEPVAAAPPIPKPPSSAPLPSSVPGWSAAPRGKLDGSAIRNMASRGLNRR